METKHSNLIDHRRLRVGLSARVLALAVTFVMLAELLIFIPSVSQFRISWLEDRLANAQIAALALLASEDNMVSESLREELLLNAQVKAVVLQRSDQKFLILSDDMPPMTGAFYDLDARSWGQSIGDALTAMIRREGRFIRVRGMAHNGPGGFVEIVIDEEPLCAAMFAYGRNIFYLSVLISFIAGGLLYLALAGFLIAPLRRLTGAMIGFRNDPESKKFPITPTPRGDELGIAEDALADMQRDIQRYIKMQSRQAALGRAMQKINHDLRNVFATVQLLSDRLADSHDPSVRRIAPRFVNAVDRALSMSQSVLKYGSAAESAPQLQQVNLFDLVNEVGQAIIVPARDSAAAVSVDFINNVNADYVLFADPDQLFRALVNLTRNGLQAIEATGVSGAISIAAVRGDGHVMIDVADTGGGVPADLQQRLFDPFISSAKPEGTGLGLAIARELVEGHDGRIELVRSDQTGSCFRICLPDRADT